MKKVVVSIVSLILPMLCQGQSFEYNFGLDYHFINSEYSKSHNYFEKSGTLNLANFTAEAGFRFKSDKRFNHIVRAGAVFSKEMGTEYDEIGKNALLYYRFDAKTTWGKFSAVFGSFPTSFSEGEYCEALLSREYKARDVAYEGMFFKYREPSFYAELGLDWFSKYDKVRRERFQILTAGDWKIVDWLHFGWDAGIYHFSVSETFANVVDNMLAHPYLKFKPSVSLQELYLSAGWIQKYDWDRQYPDQQLFNGGALATFEIRNWGFGVRNSFFFGKDLMPNYIHDELYVIYGTDLYKGNLFYHTQIQGYSLYNSTEISYSAKLGGRVEFKAGAIFHIGNPTDAFGLFRGCQQFAEVKVNLDQFR